MSRLFLTPIDLGKLELLNAAIQNLPTTSINAISSPATGQVVFDTTLHVLKTFNGTVWTIVGGAATGAGAPASAPTSSGAMYFDTTNLLLYISKGTSSVADWVPNDPRGTTGDMTTVSLNTANSAGTSLKVAPIDHVHRHVDADHAGIHLNALATATGNYSMGGYNITSVADPVNGTDAANKQYVDAARSGLDAKASVRLATTENIASLTYNATGGTSARGQITGAPSVLDGINLAANDRILIKDQTAAAANGIYVVTTLGTGANGVWDRATDFDQDAEVTAGAYVWVTEGNTQGDSGWVLTNNDPIIIGGASGTALTWVLFSSAGTLIAGQGLVKTSNQIDVVGTTDRILVNADSVDISPNYVGQTSITTLGTIGTGTWSASTIAANRGGTGQSSYTIGDILYADTSSTLSKLSDVITGNALISGGVGVAPSWGKIGLTTHITGTLAVGNGGTGATTAVGARANLGATGKYAANVGGAVSIAIPHNLNSTDVVVMTYEGSAQVECDVTITDANTVTLGFAVAPAANAIRVVVVG